mgnify:CR=1 FL=1
MKSGILLFCLSMGFSCAQDTIVLKNGRKADCKIIDFTPDAVKITYRATPAAKLSLKKKIHKMWEEYAAE